MFGYTLKPWWKVKIVVKGQKIKINYELLHGHCSFDHDCNSPHHHSKLAHIVGGIMTIIIISKKITCTILYSKSIVNLILVLCQLIMG